MKAKLIVDDVEVGLGFDELELITDSLNDNPKNSEIFHALAKSESINVRMAVASKKTINITIFKHMVNDTSVDVLRALASNTYVGQFLDNKSLEKLLATNDTSIYLSIAGKIYNLSHLVNLDWLCEILIQNDPSVRYALASNADTPVFILIELSGDRDINVAEKAKETLSNNDFDELW
jgi:hypothetical protein